MWHPVSIFKISAAWLLIILLMTYPVLAREKITLITKESWSEHIILEGKAEEPIIISPPLKINLGRDVSKIVVIPEEIKLKEEIQEFRLFRNRYVIFGIYLFTALYYNWLTRHR